MLARVFSGRMIPLLRVLGLPGKPGKPGKTNPPFSSALAYRANQTA